MTGERDIVDDAIDWHLRLADATERDWRAFAKWLEADPEHAAAYDRVAQDDMLAGVANEADKRGRVWRPGVLRRAGAWPLAASAGLAAAVAGLFWWSGAPPAAANYYTVATRVGEHRTIALGDGTRVELNGGTRLTLDRANTRIAQLDQGQAVFHVRHDQDRPFELRAGDTALRDLGTVFEVTREPQSLDVQVAEGAVLYRPAHESITLKPGMSLTTRSSDGRIVIGRVPAANVGSWRKGRLTFSEAPLPAVARAIERTTGAPVEVAPALEGRLFTGSFQLSGNAERDVPHVATLAGATYIRQKQRWILKP